jgi:competence protein ComEC
LGFIDQAGQSLDLSVSSSTIEFAVHFIDVGTGDSAIIDIGEAEIIIDGGNSTRVLHDYAESTGIIDGPIELVVVTHGDSDHWKGLTRLLGFDGQATTSHTALEFWEPGYNRLCNPLASYDQFISDVEGISGITIKRPLAATHTPSDVSGQVNSFTLPSVPGVTLTLLHSSSDPDASNGECSYRANNASIVLMVEVGGFKFLFTGDANGKERDEASPGTPGHVEAKLLAVEAQFPGTLKADVLKVPHHGSETASTQAFINAVNPWIVVISSSTLHSLPKDTVVQRYNNGVRKILRTDRDSSSDNDHIVCSASTSNLACSYPD